MDYPADLFPDHMNICLLYLSCFWQAKDLTNIRAVLLISRYPVHQPSQEVSCMAGTEQILKANKQVALLSDSFVSFLLLPLFVLHRFIFPLIVFSETEGGTTPPPSLLNICVSRNSYLEYSIRNTICKVYNIAV